MNRVRVKQRLRFAFSQLGKRALFAGSDWRAPRRMPSAHCGFMLQLHLAAWRYLASSSARISARVSSARGWGSDGKRRSREGTKQGLGQPGA